jgi:sugar-specific transcriptional regulator TrmB
MQELNTKYVDLLSKFNLKPQEAVIYLSCLKLGEATVSQLATATKIQRTFIYDVVGDLVNKGILSLTESSGVRRYSPISIDQFKKIQQEKIREFELIIPELRMFQNSGNNEPTVKFFRGKEGLVAAYQDILDSVSNTEILAYATAEGFYTDEPDFQLNYIAQRVKQGISVRAIAADLPETKKYTQKDNEQLRETRLVPVAQFPFSNEIDIYANKVVIMSLEKELLAVIIESESIAKTQRAIFELAWLGAGNFQ